MVDWQIYKFKANPSSLTPGEGTNWFDEYKLILAVRQLRYGFIPIEKVLKTLKKTPA